MSLGATHDMSKVWDLNKVPIEKVLMEVTRTEPRKQLDKNPEFDFHRRPIAKGELGQLSKIREELEEAEDAEAQGQDLMLLIELSDIIGAAAAVGNRLGFTLEQLIAYTKLRSETAENAKQAARGNIPTKSTTL